MAPLQAVVLGILQGLTEFLPVSSSGHLVLGQRFFGLLQPELLFDISLHIGTLLAVVVVFFKDIVAVLSSLYRLPSLSTEAGGWRPVLRENEQVRTAFLIGIGSIPTGIIGLGFHSAADRIFASVPTVGTMLLVTGGLLWATRYRSGGERTVAAMTIQDALIIGLMQGVAILPGISRSGATISAALLMGVERKTAGRFSFLLSLPAIVGALLIEIRGGGVFHRFGGNAAARGRGRRRDRLGCPGHPASHRQERAPSPVFALLLGPGRRRASLVVCNVGEKTVDRKGDAL